MWLNWGKVCCWVQEEARRQTRCLSDEGGYFILAAGNCSLLPTSTKKNTCKKINKTSKRPLLKAHFTIIGGAASRFSFNFSGSVAIEFKTPGAGFLISRQNGVPNTKLTKNSIIFSAPALCNFFSAVGVILRVVYRRKKPFSQLSVMHKEKKIPPAFIFWTKQKEVYRWRHFFSLLSNQEWKRFSYKTTIKNRLKWYYGVAFMKDTQNFLVISIRFIWFCRYPHINLNVISTAVSLINPLRALFKFADWKRGFR